MKKFIVIIVFILLTFSKIYSVEMLELDKIGHFSTTGLITYSLIDAGFTHDEIIFLVSTISAFKEQTDQSWDNEDVFASYCGMCFVFFINYTLHMDNVYIVSNNKSYEAGILINL